MYKIKESKSCSHIKNNEEIKIKNWTSKVVVRREKKYLIAEIKNLLDLQNSNSEQWFIKISQLIKYSQLLQ